tara:strand:- start:4346 stop:4504 length:159 start_codon:yes stop_codon:yes gene_type:complete
MLHSRNLGVFLILISVGLQKTIPERVATIFQKIFIDGHSTRDMQEDKSELGN